MRIVGTTGEDMKLLLIAPLVLAGCAVQPQEPLTDSQRAMVLQMLMNRPAVQMPQVQMPPPMPVQQQFNCTTIPIGGGQTTTRCTN